MKWEHIATAPQDYNTEVLLCEVLSGGNARVYVGSFVLLQNNERGWVSITNRQEAIRLKTGHKYLLHPDYWMPLPPPPKLQLDVEGNDNK